MNEELLKQILDEMKDMKKQITRIESNMATKSELQDLKSDIQDIKADLHTLANQERDDVVKILEKVDEIGQKVDTRFEDLAAGQDILVKKLFQHEKDLHLIKKAK